MTMNFFRDLRENCLYQMSSQNDLCFRLNRFRRMWWSSFCFAYVRGNIDVGDSFDISKTVGSFQRNLHEAMKWILFDAEFIWKFPFQCWTKSGLLNVNYFSWQSFHNVYLGIELHSLKRSYLYQINAIGKYFVIYLTEKLKPRFVSKKMFKNLI